MLRTTAPKSKSTQQTIYAEGGQMPLQQGGQVVALADLNDQYGGHAGIVRSASATLGHEVAHRTGTIPNDDKSQSQSVENQKAVEKACGY